MKAKIQRRNALVGALVADAASMGLHWMYDQEHIKMLEKSGDVLFRQPDGNVYAGVKSYFAHAAKRVGEFSQYGESALVVSRVIDLHGSYAIKAHQTLFFDTFGPCGSYHGFADRPTKALVVKMLNDSDEVPGVSGSDDDQLPALCSVPALFAHEASNDDITNAVSVTSTNSVAINGAHVLNDCLNRLHSGESLREALRNAVASADSTLKTLMQEAISQPSYRPLEMAQQFGLACHMEQGLPLVWHLLRHAENFEDVVRDNIRCGGDSCGRSMALGSIAGLVYGVPDTLKNRVDRLH